MSARRRLALASGFGAAAVLRVAWLAAFEDNWDMEMYRQFAEAAPRGGALYTETVYPYSPVWGFVVFGVSRLVAPLGIPFEKAIGVLLLAADVATAYVIFRILRHGMNRSREVAVGGALLFFANPVSVIATGFHLQWDNLAVLFLVLAVWFSLQRPKSPAASAVALTASLLVKHVAFFHPLVFAIRSRAGRRFVLLTPYVFFLASFLPYWSTREIVFQEVFQYRSHGEDYGVAMLSKLPGMPEKAPKVIFVAAVLFSIVAFRKVELARGCLLLSLVIIVFVPGIVQYYFVWPIALGSLYPNPGYAVFTLLFSAFFLGSPDGLGLPIPHLPGWHGMWWGAVLWLLWELRELARRRRA